AATLLTAALESRQSRADSTRALRGQGAPVAVLRTAATTRAFALLVVFVPLTWAVSTLAALPLSR
ncbi:hypothetical protein HY68_02180, partial [Streptomyces sp. AcH 505]